MNEFFLKTGKLFPLLSCLFSLTVIVVTILISDEISLIFVYFSSQVYLNWISINRISGDASVTMTSVKNDARSFVNRRNDSCSIQIREKNSSHLLSAGSTINGKMWFCEKCGLYTIRPSRHCALCKKCFNHRDHHCFFIGNCIIRKNMGNFIIICVYTSLSSIYSLTVIGPYLYDHIEHVLGAKSSAIDVILNFSFPVALARFILYGKDSCIVLVTLFDVLLSISCICSAFGFWKFYACLTGRQRYYPNVAKKYNIYEIFGKHGLWNIIFPFDGIFEAKCLTDTEYLSKEI